MWSLTIVLPQPFRRFTSQIGRDVVFWSEVWPYPKTNICFIKQFKSFWQGSSSNFFSSNYSFLFHCVSQIDLLSFGFWKKKKLHIPTLSVSNRSMWTIDFHISAVTFLLWNNPIRFDFDFDLVWWFGKSSAECFLSWIISWKFQILSKKKSVLHKHKHKWYIVMKIYLSFKYNIKNEISKKNSSRKTYFAEI